MDLNGRSTHLSLLFSFYLKSDDDDTDDMKNLHIIALPYHIPLPKIYLH